MKNYLKSLGLCAALLVFYNCSSSGDEPVAPPATQKAMASIVATLATAMEPATNGEFTLKLSKSVATETILNLKLSGTAKNGEDYKLIGSTILIPAKSTLVVLPIEILADQIVEGDETVVATISIDNNANVLLGTETSAVITIKDGAIIVDLKPGETRSYMVDKNATDETVALFYNLKKIAKTSFILGQQDAMISNYQTATPGNTDIKKITGNDPGLNGLDFMFITDDQNTGEEGNWYYGQEKMIIEGAVRAYDRGMINTFSWHIREPYEGKVFSTETMSATIKSKAFKSILVGGENHEYYKKKLDKVGQVFKNLKGSDGKLIPVIFRPWHEFDGNWFWWGAAYCTPAEFKQNYQFTVTYLRDVLGVKNLLFAFSPDQGWNSESEYLSRYPGDAFVDVLGFDDYEDFKNKGESGVNNANKKLQIISKLAKERVKIAALTETGYIIKPSAPATFISNLYTNNYYRAMTDNNIEISYMAFWNNGSDSYSTPISSSPYENDFVQFTRKDKVVLLNKLPNMYKLPQ
ncbi:glycosyl hydrolase [Flavobacterium sp. TMP13]|uniref:glycosyl hydrolase n=1 Tax=Flavobacterium sp. TMP13 TaxID=3425950 RepID=UPI003D780CFF